jgi:hypothetical protein
VGTTNILNELHFDRRYRAPTNEDRGQQRIRSHHVRQRPSRVSAIARDHETAKWASKATKRCLSHHVRHERGHVDT